MWLTALAIAAAAGLPAALADPVPTPPVIITPYSDYKKVGDFLVGGLGDTPRPLNEATDVIIWGNQGHPSIIPPDPPISFPPPNTETGNIPTYAGTGYSTVKRLEDLFGPALGMEPGQSLDDFALFVEVNEKGNDRSIQIDTLKFELIDHTTWNKPGVPEKTYVTYSLDTAKFDNAVLLDEATGGVKQSDYEFKVDGTMRLALVPKETIVRFTLEMSELTNGGDFMWASKAKPLEGEFDLGDLPEDDPATPEIEYKFQTTLASGGAVHAVGVHERLGDLWDSESDGQPTEDAAGDDATGQDDEDGVWYSKGQFHALISVNEEDRLAGRYSTDEENDFTRQLYLEGWVDIDQDGDFDADDPYFYHVENAGSWTENTKVVDFPCPFGPGPLFYYSRWRLSYGSPVERPWGYAYFGEVEDLLVIPEPATVTLLGLGALALLRRRRRRAS